jgi:hypothetical protein
MSAEEYISNIRGPFKALEDVEQALSNCEAILNNKVRSVADISSIPNHKRVTLLVEFAGGLKAKLTVSASDHKFVDAHKQTLDLIQERVNFPQVLAAGEGWMAFEWIDGTPLRQHGINRSLLREAARLLSAIHQIEVFLLPEDARKTIHEEVHDKLKRNLPVLVSNEIISETEQEEILGLSRSMSQQECDISLIHGDFSPNNLVVREDELISVDNEKIRVHATDYDLCRATSLWDEWNASGPSLLEAYSEISQRSLANESLFFWGVFDLVYRISYRISLGEFNEFCINRLRQILTKGAFR